MIYTSFKVRQMSSTRGLIFDQTKKIVDKKNEDNHDELVSAFLGDVRQTKTYHLFYLAAFQAGMLLIDKFLFGHTARTILAYQLVWLGFATSLLQVRPYILFCVLLSQTMVDKYTKDLCACNSSDDRSWLDMTKEHQELELDISNIWKDVNLLVFVPPIPFLTFAVLHFLSDDNFVAGWTCALYLAIMAGLATTSVLVPIARISSMINSSAAFKGKLTKKRGSMSIRAVARSFAGTLRSSQKRPHDLEEYGVLLDYLQGHKFSVHVGLPWIYMFAISKESITGFFFFFHGEAPSGGISIYCTPEQFLEIGLIILYHQHSTYF